MFQAVIRVIRPAIIQVIVQVTDPVILQAIIRATRPVTLLLQVLRRQLTAISQYHQQPTAYQPRQPTYRRNPLTQLLQVLILFEPAHRIKHGDIGQL